MAGYFRRLAQQSGLLPGAQQRARGEAADIVEVHEERVVGAGDLAPAAAGGDAPASVYMQRSAPVATPAGEEPSLAPGVPPFAPSAPADTADVVARRSHQARVDDFPAAARVERMRVKTPAKTATGSARAAGARTPIPGSAATAADVAPVSRPGRAATGPALSSSAAAMHSPEELGRTAPAARSRATAVPGAPPAQMRNDSTPGDAGSAPPETAAGAPRRTTIAAAAAVPGRTAAGHVTAEHAPAPRARESGVKVRIGRINLEIHAPSPKPAPVPFFAAPPASAAAPASAQTPFSAHRHYLRGPG